MLKEVKNFLNGTGKFVEIEYKGKRLEAAVEWYKLRNPLGIIFRGFMFSIFKIIPPSNLKNYFYRIFGVRIGKDVMIGPNVLLDPLFPELIEIKDGAIIGWGSKILAHDIIIKKIRLGRVKIGRKTVIGAFSVLREGITIGDNCIIAMSSYVNKDVNDNLEVGGVPEHKIKRLISRR